MKNSVKQIIKILDSEYPNAKSALKYQTPLQMLIATILSAQTTDERVNMVTPGLFKKYRTVDQFAKAPVEDIQNEIRSVNYYKTKGKNIKTLSQLLLKNFQGQVPDSMEELITLPGVARKTANVVLGEAFGKTEGFVVDTHVKRLSFRLGLTEETKPEKIEVDLMELIPQKHWIDFSMQLILHGRKVCIARNPKCHICKLDTLCPYFKNTLKTQK
ncbi:endonuclease III [bacterium]|nr:endonuclease III [bacterium]